MRQKVALATLALLIFANVIPISAFAQSNTGTLVGTVMGPDGVVVGANVVVTDNATGKERTATSGENGNFTISQLDPGTYTVKVSAPGFKTYTAIDLKIDIGKEYNLVATLEVGEISETVTVTAGEDLVHASSAELSNTVGPRQIQELPLNGRNPLALISLQAGVSQNGAQNTSINGLQPTFTNITRDGINVQDNFIRSNATDFIPDRPNVDDVGEFTIVTQNAGAELGYGSAQIQLVTPRGANEFHGGVYLYNRNSKFAANGFFNNSADPAVERPFLNRNQFGGKLGGRIIRDKLFFFGAYEGFRLRQSTNPNRTILLPQARQGIFTYLDNSGVRRSVNILSIAGIGIDPVVQSRIIDRTPISGNNTDAGDQLNTTGFRFNQKQNQDREAFTLRMDHEISQDQSLNGVYSYREEFLLRPDIENGGGFNSTPFGFQDAQTHFLALAHRWTMSDSFTNEIRGGFQFSKPAFGRTDEPTDFFFTIPLISSPESTFQTQGRDTEIWNIQDNAAWIRGVHAVRFGGQLQAFRTNPYGPPAFSNSTIPTLAIGVNPNTPQISASQFNNPALFPGGISTTQRTTANNLLALLGGIVSSAQLTFNATSQTSGFVAGLPPRNTQERQLDYENLSLYVSDQWRLRPNLTLNLGLRYELFTPLREANGLALEPVIPRGGDPVAAILDPNGIYDFVGTNSGGTNFHRADRDNFAPVASFAYSPNFEKGFLGKLFPGGGRSVLRGGFRVSYVNDEFVRAADNALRGNAGLTQTVLAVNPATGTTQLNRRLSDGPPTFDTPEFKVPRTFAENNALAGLFGTVFAVDPNLQAPRILEYNISIERELGFDTAVEFRYVGGRSDNLVRGIDLNQVDIRGNGFLEDFIRARNNLNRFGSAACPNPSTGCEPLTVFPRLGGGGLLTNATVVNQLRAGTPADLAIIYVTNNLAGNVRFLANPNTGAVDFLTNLSKYRYNAFQAELRRRFSQGLYFQMNYTFQKTLTDAQGIGQTNFEPFLDNNAPRLEYARANFDQTHIFNFNGIYELPFGAGKRWLNNSGLLDRVLGGWQLTSIVRIGTGAPISITDPRGTLNRVGRSGVQTASSNLSKDAIKDLIGVHRTPCGVFYINPSAIDINLSDCSGSGRAALGFGEAPFPGQVFFNNGPGETGNLERLFINGPLFANWDASLIKNIRIKENYRLQFRAEAFNVLNRANFFVGQSQNINSENFMRISQTFDPRIIQFVGRFEF